MMKQEYKYWMTARETVEEYKYASFATETAVIYRKYNNYLIISFNNSPKIKISNSRIA